MSSAPPKATNAHVYFDDDGNVVTDAKSADKTGNQDDLSGSGDAPLSCEDVKDEEVADAVEAVEVAQEPTGMAQDSENVDDDDEFLTADELVDGDDDVDVVCDTFFDAGYQKPVFANAQVWISFSNAWFCIGILYRLSGL